MRFARGRAEPAAAAGLVRELAAETTEFGETLAAYDFVPEPGHEEAVLADYRSALDAYEKAKRLLGTARSAVEVYATVREVLDEGRQALTRLDVRRQGHPVRPPGAPRPRQRVRPRAVPSGEPLTPGEKGPPENARLAAHARRTPVVRLDGPGPQRFDFSWDAEAPAVLVLRTVSYGRDLSTELRTVRRGVVVTGPRGRLLRTGGDFTARLPVPAGGARAFHIVNGAVAGAGFGSRGPYDARGFDVDRIPHWEAWLESTDTCREFDVDIRGEGWEVVRYSGARTTARFTRDGRRGEVVVRHLDPGLRPVQQLLRGYRAVAGQALVLPRGPVWLAVHCRGAWRLTAAV